MNCNHSKKFQTLSVILFVILAFSFPAFSQDDPNPNSPTPVLLSAFDLGKTGKPEKLKKNLPSKMPTGASEPIYSKVALYVANIEPMTGEEASAFRVYAEDSTGKKFFFPVADFELIDADNRIYKLVFALKFAAEEEKNAQTDFGSFLLSVSWRGLESNKISALSGSAEFIERYEAEAVRKFQSAKSKQAARAGDAETNAVGYRFSGDRKRFLEQTTFGPTPALDDRVRRLGLRVWLAEQFDMPYPSANNPYPNFPLRPINPPTDCDGLINDGNPDPDPFCYLNHYSMYPMQNWFYKEAFYGDAQLRHRVAWALAQMWVTSGTHIIQTTHMANYHKVLSRNAFGNWRTLMREMTLNPAMGAYLDMRTSTRSTPNENYAREILQLFNVGLYMLDEQGRVKINPATNEPIPTYGQSEVTNFTAVFTGWNLCESTGGRCPNRALGAANFIDPMIISNADNHDLTAKTLLTYPGSTTTNVPACTGCTGTQIMNYAENSFNQALDNIYNHPNTAPFVSKFLIQQLVTGDPTPAYVGRVAAVFNANRTNPAQMKEVIKAILLDPEARGDAKTDPHYGKLREPVLYLTNIARQFDARSADRSVLSDGVVTAETSAMEQTAFMAPSVFNYYAPEYIVPGTTFNGPEFMLFTTGTSINRMNLANTLVFNRININAERRVTSGTSLSLADIQAFAESDASGNRLMDALNIRLMHGTMSAQMRETILNAVLTVPASDPLLRAKRAVYLVITSSQYQVQK